MPKVGPATVLVIDPLEETREVLRTVLSRRGVRIVTARRADQGLLLARQHRPDVIVLDRDAPSRGNALDRETVRLAIDRDAEQSNTPVVHLCSSKIGPREGRVPAEIGLQVRKPYQYAPLVHKIEELLAQRRAA